MRSAKPKDIDAYLETVSPERRRALEKLRKAIHLIIPDCEECICYSMPAFRLEGIVVAGFLATKSGCSYYPFSGKTLATLGDELADYAQTKGALHFDPKRPLPNALVRKLIRTRILENPKRVRKPTVGSGSAPSATSKR